MTAREAMDHPWLAPVRELSHKKHADEMSLYGMAPGLPLSDAPGSGSSAAGAGDGSQ